MNILINTSIVLGTFAFMEGVAWFSHKYIMHGFGWKWHADHHNHHKGFFEKNDYYAVVFSIIASFSIIYGSMHSYWHLFYFGIGITLYGVSYFVFHDLIVHRRIKFKYTPKNGYMKRIMNAHYVHHKVHTKHGAEAFGFLFAPKKYEAKQKQND